MCSLAKSRFGLMPIHQSRGCLPLQHRGPVFYNPLSDLAVGYSQGKEGQVTLYGKGVLEAKGVVSEKGGMSVTQEQVTLTTAS